MPGLFEIDGKTYNVGVESLQRSAQLRDGPTASKALSGRYWRDLQGTFIDYTLQISASGMSQEDYDAMYEVLISPVDSHKVVVPYGQSTITYDAYIDVVQDEVELMDDMTVWGNMTITFYTVSAQRKPN